MSKTPFNIYLTDNQSHLLSQLQAAGLSMSSVTRIALRRTAETPLPSPDQAVACPHRANVYLNPDDIDLLKRLADTGNITKAEVLRRAISIYLTEHARPLLEHL